MIKLTPENTPSKEAQAPGPDRVAYLREQITELKKRWPPHSVPPGMLQRLDDLEEELEEALR